MEFRTLQIGDEDSFRMAVAEFANEIPPWNFAFSFDHATDFPEYVARLERWSQGQELPENFVQNSFYVGVVDGTIVGRLSLRHKLNDWLSRIGGHIGYGVIPSQRRHGYATEMLRRSLPICAQLGITQALVTCDEDNEGSRKVIEACGGVFEESMHEPGTTVPKRRYWIDCGSK